MSSFSSTAAQAPANELQSPRVPSTTSKGNSLDRAISFPRPARLLPAARGDTYRAIITSDSCYHQNSFPINNGLRFTPKGPNIVEVSIAGSYCFTSREAIERTFAGRLALSDNSWAAIASASQDTTARDADTTPPTAAQSQDTTARDADTTAQDADTTARDADTTPSFAQFKL
ncbi:hypothetical protein V491_06218 [Pseudogymnoascus sp. VKM F-3775]|nr:hypothetical protein V491_06218 [Pseudogymnoascus sp. VKM F-3775]